MDKQFNFINALLYLSSLFNQFIGQYNFHFIIERKKLMSQSFSTIYILNHIIDENVYNLIDQSYVQIGKLFLQTILKKVAIITLRDASLSQAANHLFIRKCVQYLTADCDQTQISTKSEKVYMFLGEMFVCKQFDYLHAFQNQIATIIKEEKGKMQLSLNQSIIRQMDVNSLDCCNNSLIEVIDLLQQRQIVPSFKSFEHDSQMFDKIDSYLLSVRRYKSQLNYLCQMMKIPFPTIDVIRNYNYYEIKLALSFQCIYLNKRFIHIKATSLHPYYQQALQTVYCKFLRQIYQTLPQLWKDFVSLKSKKKITT